MGTLRRWQLGTTSPYALQLAADARLSQTDYTDDQTWELHLGEDDTPALAMQTRFGGRVGLASLVPMWVQDGHSIYQTQTYAVPPVIIAFAPGYAQIEAGITPELALTADFRVMESHAVGGRFTVTNAGPNPAELRLDLFGHVIAERREQPLAILSLVDGTQALSLGRLRGLEPVVMMEQATAEISPGMRKASPKIGVDLTFQPGERVHLRWVHAGLHRVSDSLERAQFWLSQDWDALDAQIEAAADAIPVVHTGNTDQDATIAFSYQQLLQAFLNPTNSLPYASFVATRQPGHGFSPRGDGSDYERGWSGQSPHLAYLVALGVASVAPQLAQGIVRNFLAVQAENGAIDARPGLGGQRQELLCPPLLARLAWEIYQYTRDETFLADVFPGLFRFFACWFGDDEGLPAWTDERQTGYVFWPTFSPGQNWAQGADIRYVESPDMAAYLLSEAASLQAVANELNDGASAGELAGQISRLQQMMGDLWRNDRFAYRDRETQVTSTHVTVLEDVRGDEEHLPAFNLDPPSRLVVHVYGGAEKAPQASVYLEGLDNEGNTISETAGLSAFAWRYGSGAYTSRNVYTMIDRVRFEGLSRVFRINVHTIDLTRLDVNAVLPLWSPGVLQDHQVEELVKLVEGEEHFLRPNGLTIVSAQDSDFDPSSADGGGGVWPFWTTIVGEGLVAFGRLDLATELVRRLLEVQAQTLRQDKRFTEFYHSDAAAGLGEDGHVGGIVPLHLLMRVLGVRVLDSGHVWTGGPFAWNTPVTIRQHGVMVERSFDGTRVEFPSGHATVLDADAEWQLVKDPAAVAVEREQARVFPLPPEQSRPSNNRVIIGVERDDSQDE